MMEMETKSSIIENPGIRLGLLLEVLDTGVVFLDNFKDRQFLGLNYIKTTAQVCIAPGFANSQRTLIVAGIFQAGLKRIVVISYPVVPVASIWRGVVGKGTHIYTAGGRRP
jgi:hypothetical protein